MKRDRFYLPAGLAAWLLALTVIATPAGAAAGAEKGFIGMQVQGMSERIAKALGLKSKNGVLVRDIALGGASDKAGFRRGDLILEFGGKKIETFEAMVKAASATKSGQKIKVAILRAGKPMTLTLVPGEWTPAWHFMLALNARPQFLSKKPCNLSKWCWIPPMSTLNTSTPVAASPHAMTIWRYRR